MRNKHPLNKEVKWIKKNWPFVEISNYSSDGYLIISIGARKTGGAGRIFLQDDIQECIKYIKNKLKLKP